VVDRDRDEGLPRNRVIPDKGLDRMVPLRVQMHADVAVKSDAEYAEFAAWWLRRLRQVHREFSGLSDSEIDQLPCHMSGGHRLGEINFEDRQLGCRPLTLGRDGITG